LTYQFPAFATAK